MTYQRSQQSGTDRLAGVVADMIQGVSIAWSLAMLAGVIGLQGVLWNKGVELLPPWFQTTAGVVALRGGIFCSMIGVGVALMVEKRGLMRPLIGMAVMSSFMLVPFGFLAFLGDPSASLPVGLAWFAGIAASASGWAGPIVAILIARNTQ